MKTTQFFTLAYLILFMNLISTGQTTEISGTISNDTIWSSDTVMVIGDITIAEGVRLTITPGVLVQLQDYYKINVVGSLHAIGSEADSITFTVADSSGFYANNNSIDGAWDGIQIIGGAGNLDTTIFNYCRIEFGKNFDTISGNINGGVIYAYNYGTLYINNCLITNNTSIGHITGSCGGAIYCEEIKNISIYNNRFTNNMSNNCGGAISIDRLCENVEISSNYFLRNSSNLGSAIHSSDLIYGHVIANNYCFNNYNVSNGIIYTSNPYGWIYNNVICNNEGTGIIDGHQMSNTKIFGNTIANNIVPSHTGAIRLFSKAYVYNNICWGNKSETGDIYDQIFVSNMSYPHLKNNCVEYGDGGNNAIYDNPKFVDPSSGVGPQYDGESADWSLVNESTSVNAGTIDTANLNIPENDIAGNNRIFGNRIDIGAYENQNMYVSTEEILSNNDFQLFPNPGKDNIRIDTDIIDNDLVIEMFNTQGKKVLNKSINLNNSLDVSFLPQGSYFYRTYKKNEIQKTGIWIKN